MASHSPVVVTENPRNYGTPLASLGEPLTPVDLVYVRNHFHAPRVHAEDWRLEVIGTVDGSSEFTLQDLFQFPRTTRSMVLECAGNGRKSMTPVPKGTPWGYEAVSRVQVTGTPLRHLLETVGYRRSVSEIVFIGMDSGEVEPGKIEPFARSLSLVRSLEATTLLVWEMNGQPLTRDHGFPLRLVVPGWYGMASVKWLKQIRLQDHAFQGFFQSEHYVYLDERGLGNPAENGQPVQQIRVRSLITTPVDGDAVQQVEKTIEGIAWSGVGQVTEVLVSYDGGEEWHAADLQVDGETVHWFYRWTPGYQGTFELASRAMDSKGNRQPLSQRWNRLGYGNNAVQTVRVNVTG